MDSDNIESWDQFRAELVSLIKDILLGSNIGGEVLSRTKSLSAIQEKLRLKTKKYGMGGDLLDLVPDLVGVRILVPGNEDVKATCDVLVAQLEVLKWELRTEDSQSWARMSITIDGTRAALPEWAKYRGFQAEVQVTTYLANAVQLVEHTLRYSNAPISNSYDRKVSSLEERLQAFANMINRTGVHEKRDIHPFLKDNPFILDPAASEIFSEVPIGLGTQFRIDFMIRDAHGAYTLVEIESSTHRIFTASGDFSAAVNHGQRQIEDWQQWIEENLPMVQRNYPDMLAPAGLLVIGRSNDLNEERKRRLRRRNINMRGHLLILTYDDLLNRGAQFIRSIRSNLI